MKKKPLAAAALVMCAIMFSLCLFACADKKPGKDPEKPDVTKPVVTFDTMGGTEIGPVEAEKGSRVPRPSDPVKAGAEFVDWYLSSSLDGEPYDFDTPVNSSFTLYAKWNDFTYYVQFDVNGGYPVVPFQTIKHGDKINAPTEPARGGYTFGGWYTDVKCETAATFPYEITRNTNFYAKWNGGRDVVVRFGIAQNDVLHGLGIAWEDDSGMDYSQEVAPSITIKAGEKLEQPADPADIVCTDGDGNKQTYKFEYWSSSAVYNSINQSYAILFPIRNTDVEEITLYAVYRKWHGSYERAKLTVHPENGERETVMYGVKGGKLNIAPLDSVNTAPFYSDRHVPYYPGYKATGYYKSSDLQAENIYQIPFDLENAENHVYIRWEKQAANVAKLKWEFMTEIETPYEYGGYLERPENPFKPGYTFDGWYKGSADTADLDKLWDFDTDYAFDSNGFTLNAKWVKTSTTVSFDTRGGYKLDPVAVTAYGRVEGLPSPVRRDGGVMYEFLGWYLDSSCTNAAKLPLIVKSDITLYAKWSDPVDISKLKFNYRGNGVYSVSVKDSERDNLSGKLTLPSRYAGYEIRSVESLGFEDCVNLAEVSVPDTYKYLYTRSFAGCTSLVKVSLPNSIIQIASGSFKDCTSLSDVDLPENLVSVQANCFADSPKVRAKFDLHNGMYYWGTVLMGNANAIEGKTTTDKTVTSLTVRDGTTAVASGSLYYMRSLVTLTLADSVKYVTDLAYPSSGLKTLNLSKSYLPIGLTPDYPSSLETINVPADNKYYEVIDGCLFDKREKRVEASVKSATKLPDGAIIIDKNAFSYKTNLNTVIIPDTVTTIRAGAFSNCGFSEIVIPDSVGILDSSAFKNCSRMANFTLGAKLPVQTKELFNGMRNLSKLTVSDDSATMQTQDNVLYDKKTYDIIYVAEAYSGDITILDGAKNVPNRVFRGEYETFTLSDSVETIEDSAFYGATIGLLKFGKNTRKVCGEDLYSSEGSKSITNFYVPEDNPYMIMAGDLVYSKDMTELLFVPYKKPLRITLPDSVTKIRCGDAGDLIVSLHIGAGISREEFMRVVYGRDDGNPNKDKEYVAAGKVTVSENNPELTVFSDVVFTKDKQHIVYIPAGFSGNLVLPKEMTSLDEMLYAMTSLNMMHSMLGFRTNSVTINKLSVEEGSRLESIGEYVLSPYYWRSAAKPDWIPNGSMYEYSTRSYVKFTVKEIDLTNAVGLKTIGERVCENNADVQSVKLPDSVESIGLGAFAMCSKLTSFEASLVNTDIGAMAFYYSALYDENNMIVIGGALVGLKDSGVDWSEVTLVIPEGVTAILHQGVWAYNLKSVVLPESVTVVKPGGITPRDVDSLTVYLVADAVPEGFAEGWYDDGGATVRVVTGYVANA